MSLTSCLDRRHPVREWFEARLPHLATVQTRWKELGPPTVNPSDELRSSLGAIGSAIDYRLRFLFDVGDPETFVAALAPHRLLDNGQATRDLYAVVVDHLSNLAALSSPVGRVLADDDERAWLQVCYALALFDACSRSEQAFKVSPFHSLPLDAQWVDIAGLVSTAAVDDLLALSQAVAGTDLMAWLGRRKELNPVFSGSRYVGGADADLIVGDCLLEIKTSKATRPDRDWIYQLVSYALLDLDDEFGIEQVGFVLPRVPAVLTFELDQLLSEMADAPVSKVGLRQEFREMLTLNASPAVGHRG